jgi:hypothetical protein
MDQGSEFKGRFCWPAQDRARAKSPSTAPRKSPVFTASDRFGSETSVPAPRRSLLSSALPLLSRAASSRSSRNRFEAREVGCGCCQIGSPGHSPLFPRALNESRYDLQVPEVAMATSSNSWTSGVALGFNWTESQLNSWQESTEQTPLASPDWRVMGGQDLAEDP